MLNRPAIAAAPRAISPMEPSIAGSVAACRHDDPLISFIIDAWR
jgi:hypothetical protein